MAQAGLMLLLSAQTSGDITRSAIHWVYSNRYIQFGTVNILLQCYSKWRRSEAFPKYLLWKKLSGSVIRESVRSSTSGSNVSVFGIVFLILYLGIEVQLTWKSSWTDWKKKRRLIRYLHVFSRIVLPVFHYYFRMMSLQLSIKDAAPNGCKRHHNDDYNSSVRLSTRTTPPYYLNRQFIPGNTMWRRLPDRTSALNGFDDRHRGNHKLKANRQLSADQIIHGTSV